MLSYIVLFGLGLRLVSLQSRLEQSPVTWVGFGAFILVCLSIAVTFTASIATNIDGKSAAYVVVFFGVLPILNALADFASIGLTRYLLRKGLDGFTWWNALIDLVCGAAIFILLGCTLITYVHVVRPQDGIALLDVPALFAALADPAQRGNHWWLFIMMFSTVIPTVLHAMVGLYTLLLHYPAWLRRRVVTLLDSGGNGSDTDGWWGSMLIAG